jgi:hypothetical protein
VHATERGYQIATRRYQKFSSELSYLHRYLNSRLLPTEPEEIEIAGVISNLQNLSEHESEELIRTYVNTRGTLKEKNFLNQIETGYVTFKSKCEWMLARNLIDKNDSQILEEVRILRNAFAHARPAEARKRFLYRGRPLLRLESVQRLFVDVELILRKLRKQSGRKSVWMTVPPGYPAEMGWPQKYIDELEPSKKLPAKKAKS